MTLTEADLLPETAFGALTVAGQGIANSRSHRGAQRGIRRSSSVHHEHIVPLGKHDFFALLNNNNRYFAQQPSSPFAIFFVSKTKMCLRFRLNDVERFLPIRI